ncbi:MAG TPA: polyphosphate polymerase domain-containing protein [Polyangiaceae bacterium]|nr:polyphosphate polymerase domain-containing protein [Polyangiaceae bacterium]
MSQNTTANPGLLLDATGARAGVREARRSGPRNVAPAPALGAVPSIRTVFERFEFKYWVTEPLARRVLEFALPYLKRDPYATTREAQRNTTLYLDTRGFRFCESHLNLSPDRSKLRIRAYGRPYSKLAFFEMKRKVKTVTMKERFALPIGEVENVLLRRPLGCVVSEAAQRTMGNFLLQMCLHRAEPKLFVACFREAFESRIAGEDVRMTIDRELVYQHSEGFGFTPSEQRWRDLREGDDSRTVFGQRRAILELKFNGSPPRWMVELVRHFNLQREAFSKYTTAALQLRGRL